jgi:hypothetical protein
MAYKPELTRIKWENFSSLCDHLYLIPHDSERFLCVKCDLLISTLKDDVIFNPDLDRDTLPYSNVASKDNAV